MANKISKEDFEEWLDGPITRAYLELLNQEANEYRNLASAGHALDGEDFTKIGQKYFVLLTTARVYENMLANLTYENVFPQEEKIDDEVSANRESSSY